MDMKKLGSILGCIGAVMLLSIVSTDDFYVMELHQYHTLDWKGLIAFSILIGAGLLLHWIGENFYFEVGRRHR